MFAGTCGSEEMLLDRVPKLAKRADLDDGRQGVLPGSESEAHMRRGVDQRLARLLEHAQMADRASQHDAEFLRVGRARIVDDAAVGFQKHCRCADREEVRERLRHRSLKRLDRHMQAAGAGENRTGIDAEGKAELCRIDVRPAREDVDHPVDRCTAHRVDVDAQMNFVERNAGKRDAQRVG